MKKLKFKKSLEVDFDVMEFESCEKCKNLKSLKPGFIIIDDGISKKVKECECHKIWVKEFSAVSLAIRNAVKREGFSYDPDKDYVGKKSLNTVKKLKHLLALFDKTYYNYSFYFQGAVGTQKDSLCHWLGCQLLLRGKTVAFYDIALLLEKISTDSYSEEDKKRIQKNRQQLLELDCLIIDEAFSKDSVRFNNYTAKPVDYLSFLKERIVTKEKCTILSCRHPIEEIDANGFNKSFKDLIISTVKKYNSLFLFEDEYERIVASQSFAENNFNLIDKS